jgi:DNA polymerase-3 subunit gamma/tau
MSYQVLARKWRPRRFDELVGQSHVVRALTHALDNDRLHHAFLFSGTRGVGKTTLARILAKCLNCEQGVAATPCGECKTCAAIDEGRFVDLIEVDAASRTKVDDTRELLDNVQYAPTYGRFKVYLVDEVHMLSRHSFNALLKTLEEPPPHVKFLLATTDPQRVPVTVLSRCLQFNLKRLDADAIAGQLTRILESEGVEAEEGGIKRIARAADGSLRDGLSLLDQAVAFGGGRLSDEDVRAMLGSIERRHVVAIMEALSGEDGKALMDVVADITESGYDHASVLEEVLVFLHRVAVAQAVPDLAGEASDETEVMQFAGDMAPEDVQLFYQIGLTGRRDLPLAPDPRTGLEMTLLRMLAFRPAAAGEAAPAPSGKRAASAPAPKPAAKADENQAETAGNGAEPAKPAEPEARAGSSDWESMIQTLKLKGATRELAAHCAFGAREGHNVKLLLPQAHAHLRGERPETRLREALSTYYGEDVRLVIELTESELDTPAGRRRKRQDARQQAAVQAVDEDPTVQALRDRMGAEVLPDSIQPTDRHNH